MRNKLFICVALPVALVWVVIERALSEVRDFWVLIRCDVRAELRSARERWRE